MGCGGHFSERLGGGPEGRLVGKAYRARRPTGVNIGGAGSYIYEKPSAERPQVTGPIEVPVARAEKRKAGGPPKGPSKGGLGSCLGEGGTEALLGPDTSSLPASSVTTFTGEPNMCPRCNKRVYFGE